MKHRSLVSHRLSVWLSWILGILAVLVGAAIVTVALTAWSPVRGGLLSMSSGLRSARSAVGLIGKDFGSSSSLFFEVSSSIRTTGDVVRETRLTVNEIRETTMEMRSVILTVSESLLNLPPAINSLLGRNYFSPTVDALDRTYYSSGELISRMEYLSSTLHPVEPVLQEVADGVDSLAKDLFSTEEAFAEATAHLETAEGALRAAAESSILPLLAAGTGLIPILVGIYLIIQGVALGRLYSAERASISPIEDTD